MMKAYVNLDFGGKDLDCELFYEGKDADALAEGAFTLVKVEMVMVMVAMKYPYVENITEFLGNYRDALETLERLCIEKIQERGRV